MYNRYINSMGEQFFTPVSEPMPENEMANEPVQEESGGIFGGFKNLLSFDLDTVFLLILVYFLVADGEDDMMETLLIVAALIFLGF